MYHTIFLSLSCEKGGAEGSVSPICISCGKGGKFLFSNYH